MMGGDNHDNEDGVSNDGGLWLGMMMVVGRDSGW